MKIVRIVNKLLGCLISAFPTHIQYKVEFNLKVSFYSLFGGWWSVVKRRGEGGEGKGSGYRIRRRFIARCGSLFPMNCIFFISRWWTSAWDCYETVMLVGTYILRRYVNLLKTSGGKSFNWLWDKSLSIIRKLKMCCKIRLWTRPLPALLYHELFKSQLQLNQYGLIFSY